MSKWQIQTVAALHDPATGALVGLLGANGKEYYLPSASLLSDGTNGGVTVSGSLTASGSAATVLIQPTGGGNSLMDNVSIGQTTPKPVKTSNLGASYTDSSASPGVTVANASPRGRVQITAGNTVFTVTGATLVTAASTVLAVCTTNDATAQVRNVVPGAGTFVITLSAAATANCNIDFLVVN